MTKFRQKWLYFEPPSTCSAIKLLNVMNVLNLSFSGRLT